MITKFKGLPNCSVMTKLKIIVARVIFFYKPRLSIDALLAINMILHKSYTQALWATYKNLHETA